MENHRCSELDIEGRQAVVKYIVEPRTKALSSLSEYEPQRFRSWLFSIFFKPRMQAFSSKAFSVMSGLSIERLKQLRIYASAAFTCYRATDFTPSAW